MIEVKDQTQGTREDARGVRHGNLALPRGAREAEISTLLIESKGVRIERIVSHGHFSPPGFWYDQTEDEYVLVIEGAAHLEIEGSGNLQLGPGDWIDLPAHVRHRVAWTDPNADTVWLAVFRASVD